MLLNLDAYVEQFKNEVSSKAQDIDSTQSQDWFSLTLGWAIGKGMSVEEAHSFASFIRYQTDLG